MQEFRDGSTGDIFPVDEIVEREPWADPETAAIHFGTEIELLRKKADLRARSGLKPKKKHILRIEELERRIAKLEGETVGSGLLHEPSTDEVERFT